MVIKITIWTYNGERYAYMPVTYAADDTPPTDLETTVEGSIYPYLEHADGTVNFVVTVEGVEYPGSLEITANEGQASIVLSGDSPDTIVLTVQSAGNGNVAPAGALTLSVGVLYSFTAVPVSGYIFDHWELNTLTPHPDVGSQNPIRMIMATAYDGKTLTAYFEPAPSPPPAPDWLLPAIGIGGAAVLGYVLWKKLG